MKNFTRFMFISTILLMVSGSAWANCVLLDESANREIMNKWSSSKTITYTIATPCPADQLTFSYSESGAATGGVTVTAKYKDGSSETIIKGKSGKSQSHSFNNKIVTELQFKGTGTLTKNISNVRLTQSSYFNAPTIKEFGSGKLNSADATQTVTMDWSDAAPMQVSINGDAATQFSYTFANNSQTCAYGTATLAVSYKHNLIGAHTATLTLTNGTHTYNLNLSGTTEKKEQTLAWADDWSADKPSMPIGKEVTNAVSATSALPVIYTSSNEEVIAITQEGRAFKAIAAGEAIITATQAGNDEWAEATSISKTFVATAKKIQFIAWSQNLSRLKTTDAPVTLTAKVLIVDAETGERFENESRTLLLTYTSDNESVVKAEGNALTIIGEGETTLTAAITGDENYEAATAVMPVRVRVPSAGCEDRLVLSHADEIEFFQSNTGEIWGEAIAIDRNQGVPDKLTFQHKGEYWTFGIKYYKGSIKVQESTDGGNNWRDLYSVTPTVGTYNETEPIQLSREATHIRFVRPSGGQGYHYVKDIEVTPAQYLETTTPAISIDQSIIGDKISKELIISYSNVKDEIRIAHTSPVIEVSEQSIATECGDFGSATLHLTITPTQVGTAHDTIVLTDAVSGMTLRIPVMVQTQRNTQSITWLSCPTNVETTAEVRIEAAAQTPVHIISSDSTTAYVENGKLLIIKYGTITLTAIAEESEMYEEATLAQDITIMAVTPEITALPVASNIRIGQSFSESVLTTGSADVDGMFIWEDNSDNYLAISTEGDYTAYVMFIPSDLNWYAIVHNLPIPVKVENGAATGLQEIRDNVSPSATRKVLIDGQIYLIRGGETYDLQGRIIRK